MKRFINILVVPIAGYMILSCNGGGAPSGIVGTGPDTLWTKTFWVGLGEAGGVLEADDGKFMLMGNTQSSGESYFWLLQTDEAGDSIWSESYVSNTPMYMNSFEPTADGGFLMAGRAEPPSSGSDAVLCKTDALGNVQFQVTYFDTTDEEAHDARQTSDGGYIVIATRYYSPFNIEHEWTAWLIKTDQNGDSTWSRMYEGFYGYSVTESAVGGFVVAGSTVDDEVAGGDFWLLKTDENGNTMWNRTYAFNEVDLGLSVLETPQGGYALAGYTGSLTTILDYFLLVTDADGNELWHRNYRENNANVCVKVRSTSDGGFILAGHTGTAFTAQAFDAFILKTDGSGNELWRRIMGTTGSNDLIFDVRQTADEGYILAGNMDSSPWLVRLDSE